MINEEWFEKQKNKYLDSLAGFEFSKQYKENKEKILDKLKSEFRCIFNCSSYDELEFIVRQVKDDNYQKFVNDKLKNINLYDKSFQKKVEFMKSINLAKMIQNIFDSYENRFLTNERSMITFLRVYTLSDTIYRDVIDLNLYFGMELAKYESVIFTEDERQALNLYNSLYDTYLEYYQRFVLTLPESELKQELEEIPNELTKIETVTIEIERKTFGKNFLRRNKKIR